jgi:hypothetical protein
MTWGVILLEEVDAWFLHMAREDPVSAGLVAAAIDMLAENGPALGRPLVDRVRASRYHHMKELRPGSSRDTEVRILFAFDPAQQAVLLVAGDKSNNWQGWYRDNIKIADDSYTEWLAGDRDRKGRP